MIKNISFKLKEIDIDESRLTAIEYALGILMCSILLKYLAALDQNLIVIKPTVANFVEEEIKDTIRC